jgi:hypothetical protein
LTFDVRATSEEFAAWCRPEPSPGAGASARMDDRVLDDATIALKSGRFLTREAAARSCPAILGCSHKKVANQITEM